MLALLAYSLLERQVQQAGLHVTTRRIVEQLEGVTVIETHCHDGSVLRRLTPLTAEQETLFIILAALLAQISLTDLVPTLPALPEPAAVLLLLPPEAAMA